jgi:hypothetical protein
MMSRPSASGELFSSFIVLLHTAQLMRSISGLLSSLPAVLTSPSLSADQREPHETPVAPWLVAVCAGLVLQAPPRDR